MTWLLLSVPVCIVARVARDTLRYRREVTGPPTVHPRNQKVAR